MSLVVATSSSSAGETVAAADAAGLTNGTDVNSQVTAVVTATAAACSAHSDIRLTDTTNVNQQATRNNVAITVVLPRAASR